VASVPDDPTRMPASPEVAAIRWKRDRAWCCPRDARTLPTSTSGSYGSRMKALPPVDGLHRRRIFPKVTFGSGGSSSSQFVEWLIWSPELALLSEASACA